MLNGYGIALRENGVLYKGTFFNGRLNGQAEIIDFTQKKVIYCLVKNDHIEQSFSEKSFYCQMDICMFKFKRSYI